MVWRPGGPVFRVIVPLLFIHAALVACASTPPLTARARGFPAGHAAECSVREISRERLTVEGGREVYIEPITFVANAHGDLLLAGGRNFMYERTPDGAWGFAAGNDSLFGVIIPREGRPRVVPSPIPTRLINQPRAAAREDGAWDVVFAETRPWTGINRPDTAARLWHGVVEDTRWASLGLLPMPDGGALRSMDASSLVRYGDTLAWAQRMDRPDGQTGMVVHQHRDGAWSFDVARAVTGVYPWLAYSPAAGLILAVVQPQTEPPHLMQDGNSLLFWTRRPEWRTLRKVVPSTREQVHSPWLSFTAAGGVLSWQAWIENAADGTMRREAHAMFGRLEERNEPIVVLDSAISFNTFSAPVMLGGKRIWVFDHESGPGPEKEIRFVSDSAGTATVIGRTDNPYMTRFIAAPAGDSALLIAGGMYDAPNRIMATVLIRARLECRR